MRQHAGCKRTHTTRKRLPRFPEYRLQHDTNLTNALISAAITKFLPDF